jgi:hypothetical protein
MECHRESLFQRKTLASPTMLMKFMFITSTITASEKRHNQCFDESSAVVNTDVDKEVLMVLKIELAEMMVHVAPQIYRRYIVL